MIKSILHTDVHFGLTDMANLQNGLSTLWRQCACANLNFQKPFKRALKVKL